MTDIRPATEQDLPTVKEIYDLQVREGIATFDVEPPPLSYWLARLESDAPGDRFLVADSGTAILGYAYSSSYRPRPAYQHTRETSVYLDPAAHGQGLGRRLYDELLAGLRDDGVHRALAVIALPNPASQALHRACGYECVGVLHEVGRKFGRWIDTEWWELQIT